MNKQINLFCIGLVLSAIIFTSCPPPPEAVAVTGVSLSQSEVTLNVDESVTLTATVSPENATNKNISWSSSDETVATVDTNGLVKAVKAGTATITVKTEDGEKTATCSVTVAPVVVNVTEVSLSQSELTLNVNESVTLTVTVSPENATNKNVSWSSSDETVATVDTNGLVKALKEGTTTITVKTEDSEKTATCSVTVAPVISVTGVKLNYTQIYREQGESFILTATVEPANASNKTVTWTTSNGSIATVDNGTVTMTGSTVWKNATITCTTDDGGKTATCTVTVTQKPTASAPDANGFVTISAGSMPLNSDGSYHVTLTKAYMICDHEVTQKEWQAVMGNNPSSFSSNPASGEEQANRPVENINWYMAIAYCNKCSIKESLSPCYSVKVGGTEVDWANLKYDGIPTNFNADWNTAVCDFSKAGYRLPTEAEWEIAARGGLTGNVYAGTDDVTKLGDYAWYTDNSKERTHEVKKKQANGYGLYDMSGNVWEWCWNLYKIYANEEATDPTGVSSGSTRVARGGSWNLYSSHCSASYHASSQPNTCDSNLGFRLVRTVQ